MSINCNYQWFTVDLLCHWGFRVWTLNQQNRRRIYMAINCTRNQQDVDQEKIQTS